MSVSKAQTKALIVRNTLPSEYEELEAKRVMYPRCQEVSSESVKLLKKRSEFREAGLKLRVQKSELLSRSKLIAHRSDILTDSKQMFLQHIDDSAEMLSGYNEQATKGERGVGEQKSLIELKARELDVILPERERLTKQMLDVTKDLKSLKPYRALLENLFGSSCSSDPASLHDMELHLDSLMNETARAQATRRELVEKLDAMEREKQDIVSDTRRVKAVFDIKLQESESELERLIVRQSDIRAQIEKLGTHCAEVSAQNAQLVSSLLLSAERLKECVAKGIGLTDPTCSKSEALKAKTLLISMGRDQLSECLSTNTGGDALSQAERILNRSLMSIHEQRRIVADSYKSITNKTLSGGISKGKNDEVKRPSKDLGRRPEVDIDTAPVLFVAAGSSRNPEDEGDSQACVSAVSNSTQARTRTGLLARSTRLSGKSSTGRTTRIFSRI